MDRRAMTLSEVNAMSAEDFLAAFGGIAEHSPWVAERATHRRPFRSRETMIGDFCRAVANASRAEKLALIRAHPDLATRARLTRDSSREQKGAGLDALSAEEFERFGALNARYKERFGFPFIFAVKGAGKHDILESFEQRISNTSDAEFETALANICRIVRFRLEDKVSP
jgi:2-oxo-4-hydroxy-4-carboxy-5-ureidoimidazoline decarboxylase